MMLYSPLPSVGSSAPWLSWAPTAVSPAIILVIAAGITAFFVFVVRASLRTRRMPTRDPADQLIGRDAIALNDLAPNGAVLVRGETWSAESVGEPIARGEPVRVIGRHGLKLDVRRDE